MLQSFKNLELFRHQIVSRIDGSIKKYAAHSEDSADTISSTIFSACFSLLIALLTSQVVDFTTCGQIIACFFAFVLAYIVAFFLYHKLFKMAKRKVYNIKVHGKEMTLEQSRKLMNDFDHIVCDSTLVAKQFIQHYRKYVDLKDYDLAKFAYYEVLYYLRVALNITMSILDAGDKCINTLETCSKIDLFRIVNQKRIMESLKDFLVNHCDDDAMKFAEGWSNHKLILQYELFNQTTGIVALLKALDDECHHFSDTYFSDELFRKKMQDGSFDSH